MGVPKVMKNFFLKTKEKWFLCRPSKKGNQIISHIRLTGGPNKKIDLQSIKINFYFTHKNNWGENFFLWKNGREKSVLIEIHWVEA